MPRQAKNGSLSGERQQAIPRVVPKLQSLQGKALQGPESTQRAADVCPSTVYPYWSHIRAILTVGNNPIDTGAAVPTLEEIGQANLILILPTTAHGILLWGAGGLYYLLEF